MIFVLVITSNVLRLKIVTDVSFPLLIKPLFKSLAMAIPWTPFVFSMVAINVPFFISTTCVTKPWETNNRWEGSSTIR